MTRQAAVDAQRKLADVKRQQQQQQTEAAGTKAAGLVRVTDEDQSEQQAARVSVFGGGLREGCRAFGLKIAPGDALGDSDAWKS